MSVTKAEARLLDALRNWFATSEAAPSLRELQAALGLRSTGTIHATLKRLEGKGLVTWSPRARGTLSLTQQGWATGKPAASADLVAAAGAVLKSIRYEDTARDTVVVSSDAIGDLDLALADLPQRSGTEPRMSTMPS